MQLIYVFNSFKTKKFKNSLITKYKAYLDNMKNLLNFFLTKI